MPTFTPEQGEEFFATLNNTLSQQDHANLLLDFIQPKDIPQNLTISEQRFRPNVPQDVLDSVLMISFSRKGTIFTRPKTMLHASGSTTYLQKHEIFPLTKVLGRYMPIKTDEFLGDGFFYEALQPNAHLFEVSILEKH